MGDVDDQNDQNINEVVRNTKTDIYALGMVGWHGLSVYSSIAHRVISDDTCMFC